MKDRIMFWLDSDITTFALATFLSERYDCDMYSIIEIPDKLKNFFKTQNIVNFQKSWYYFEHINPEKNIDVEYLRSIEKKYGLNLWLLALNERLFYKYNLYYKFSSNEILSILEKECKLYEKILDDIQPNFLIIKTTDLHQNHLFYEICKAKGISILMLDQSRFGYRCIVSQERDKIDYLTNLDNILSQNRNIEELQDFLKSKSLSEQLQTYKTKFISSKKDKIKASFNYFFLSKNTNLKTHYTYYGRKKFKVFFIQLYYSIIEKYREKFINQNLVKEINKNENFIYFPLHQEPERVLLVGSPFFTNQIETVRHIAKSIPVDHKLYVKEHPTQSIRGWREISFYKQILCIPNVVFLHPDISSEEILKKCSLTITVGGTTGIESLFYEKPSIIFSDMSYGILSSVEKITSISQLPHLIRTSLQKKVDLGELDKFVTVVEQNSIDFDYTGFLLDYTNRFYYGGFFSDVDISVEDMKLFLDENRVKFNILIDEYIKKIHQHKNALNSHDT
jgi:hypothetical protein